MSIKTNRYFSIFFTLLIIIFGMNACDNSGGTLAIFDIPDDDLTDPASAPLPDSETAPVIADSPTKSVNNAPTLENYEINALLDYMGIKCPNPYGEQKMNLNGNDEDGDDLSYEVVSSPSYGTVSIDGNELKYTPGPEFDGTDSFTVKANDGTDDSEVATITVKSEELSKDTLQSDSFTDHGVVIQGTAGTDTELWGAGAPAVVYNPINKLFVMFFESMIKAADATCKQGYWGIGMATSTDGFSWDVKEKLVVNPKLIDDPSGAVPTDYDCVLAHPTVIFDGTKYKIFAKAHEQAGGAKAQKTDVYFESEDLETFTDPKVVLTGKKSMPSAILVNGILSLYYETVHPDGIIYLDREWSEDQGETWDPTTQINSKMFSSHQPWATGTLFEKTTTAFQLFPSVICNQDDEDNPYQMIAVMNNPTGDETDPDDPLYVGGFFTSTDGTDWSLNDNIAITANPFWFRHPTFLRFGNNYLVWYGKKTADGKMEIHAASTFNDWPIEEK